MAQPARRRRSTPVQVNDLSHVIPLIHQIRALAPSDPQIHQMLDQLEQTCQAKPKRNRKTKSTAKQNPAPPTPPIDGKTVYDVVLLLVKIAQLVDSHWDQLQQAPGMLADLVAQLAQHLNLPSF